MAALGPAGPGAAFDINYIDVYLGSSPTGPWTELTPTPPTNTIYVGEYVKLEMELENTTGRLGRMCVIDASDPYGPTIDLMPTCTEPERLMMDYCTQNADPSIYPGQYWVWPRLESGCSTICGDPTNCIQDPLNPVNFTSYLYPENPLAPVRFVSAIPIDTWDFNDYTYTDTGASNDTEVVEWVFQARREYVGMDFAVFAHHLDDFGDYSADCNDDWDGKGTIDSNYVEDPCLYAGGNCTCTRYTDPTEPWPPGIICPWFSYTKNFEGSLLACTHMPSGTPICPFEENFEPSANSGGPTLGQILQDYWNANVNIVSSLRVLTKLKSAGVGTRPPGKAYIGDQIELAASVTNTGGLAVSVEGRATSRFDPVDAPLDLITKATTAICDVKTILHYWPVGPQTIPSGGEQTFTWSFTVTGSTDLPVVPPSGSLYFDPVDMSGAITLSPKLFVMTPPLSITVTLWVDPDGPGPEPAQPLSPDGSHPDGKVYYMSEDRIEARILIANTSTLYSYDVSPVIATSGNAASSYPKVSGPPIGTVLLDPAPAPGSSTALVYTYELNPDSFLATNCAGPGPFLIQFEARARGVWSRVTAYISDHPFRPAQTAIWAEILGLSGGNIEVLESFDVNMHVRNPLGRAIVMSSRTSAYLEATKPPGDNTQWLFEVLPSSFALTWNAGELKPPFTWRIKPTASGTLYLCTGVKYGAINTCVKAFPALGCVGPTCPCSGYADKIVVLTPQFLEVVSFTATPTFAYADGGKFHGVELSLTLYNESPSETIYVESFKIPCVAEGGWELGMGASVVLGPVPAPPFEIPPKFSFSVDWLINSHCDTDRRFGYYPSPACFPLVYGRLLTSSTLIQQADAITSPALTLRDPPRLQCSLFLEATEYSEGEDITLYFSVTNTNQNDALDYSVTVTADYLLTAAQVSPSLYLTEVGTGLGPPTILPGSGLCGPASPPGAAQVYKAVYHADRGGKVRFYVTASHSDIVYGERPACGQVSPVINIKKTSTITATAWATATVTMPQDCLGCAVESGCQPDGTNCISVGLSVRNSGEVPVDDLTPLLFLPIFPCSDAVCPLTLSYTGDAVQISSPPPEDLGQPLPGYDTTRSFTWTYSSAGIGCLKFKISVNGIDHDTGEPRYAEVYTNCVRILPQPPVTLRLLGAPAKVIIGQEFEADIEIENPGKNPVLLQGGEPSLSFIMLANQAVATEHFEVRLPPPVTVNPGEKAVVTVKIRALPTAPLGAVRLRVPEGAAFIAVDVVTGLAWLVRDAGAADPPVIVELVAASYALEGADPNPFRPARDGETLIKFRIPEEGRVQLRIYTITGELVRKIIDEDRPVGYYEQSWDGTNDDRQPCASGIYLIRIEGPNYSQVGKLAIIK